MITLDVSTLKAFHVLEVPDMLLAMFFPTPIPPVQPLSEMR